MDNPDDREDIIRTLNTLIETCKDGEADFKSCAADAKRPDLQEWFTTRSKECGSSATELQRSVVELGGKPGHNASVSGELHRRWVDLKSLVSGKDEQVIFDEAERDGTLAAKQYAEALHQTLPTEIRAMVERQYEGVQRNHAEIRAMRNGARAG
ncbi:PA2169 family four-helix-bundle protein [Pseudomonas sp. BN411]|uniref:PA2169 family four-helix-bundle protein n=1 Tax=Pseudomonas sp. BN411 TaxID=2567887 RepID=UPI00245543BA|nr:PA2169 family four-helix-bundle protein [Pseudomonas sp. BN411]MDH4563874.1 PA2169 family four-helix-bundle protein [Pseudomonas sp. BN411]